MKPGIQYGHILGGVWLVIGLWIIGAFLLPASFWLEVRSVHVLDAVEGTTPVMQVDRTIHQHFAGTYTVDVERQSPRGGFYPVCSVRSSTNYRTDAELPEPVTLDWWTWPVSCQIGPGVYRVETNWHIEPVGFPDKDITVMSNTFAVLEQP